MYGLSKGDPDSNYLEFASAEPELSSIDSLEGTFTQFAKATQQVVDSVGKAIEAVNELSYFTEPLTEKLNEFFDAIKTGLPVDENEFNKFWRTVRRKEKWRRLRVVRLRRRRRLRKIYK